MDSVRFVARVEEFIRRHRLLGDSVDPVVVGLSGGADSVALLSVLAALGHRCIAAHVNYHLRGDESDRDERHACAVARRLGCEFEVLHADVPQHRRDNGGSVEMACREIRYVWFDELCRKHGAAAVAVAHNADDNCETFFLKVLRRSAVSALGGMRPRNGRVIRPLLCVHRSDIEMYLQACGLQFVTDSSNLANDYQRNRLRNVVLPALYSQFPRARRAVEAQMEICAAEGDFVTDISREIVFSRYCDARSGAIDVERLMADYPRHCRLILLKALDGKLGRERIADIFSSVGMSGRIFDGFLLDRGRLLPVANVEERIETGPISALPSLMIEERPIAEFDARRCSRDALYLDGALNSPDCIFTLRGWREGDRMEPFGMRGSRLLSDIYSDAHLSVNDKRSMRVLEFNGDILWAAPLRASRHYGVTPECASFLVVRLR